MGCSLKLDQRSGSCVRSGGTLAARAVFDIPITRSVRAAPAPRGELADSDVGGLAGVPGGCLSWVDDVADDAFPTPAGGGADDGGASTASGDEDSGSWSQDAAGALTENEAAARAWPRSASAYRVNHDRYAEIALTPSAALASARAR
jgi:hypothetical protein